MNEKVLQIIYESIWKDQSSNTVQIIDARANCFYSKNIMRATTPRPFLVGCRLRVRDCVTDVDRADVNYIEIEIASYPCEIGRNC